MELFHQYVITERAIGPFHLGQSPESFRPLLQELSGQITISYELFSDHNWKINIGDTLIITVNIWQNKIAQLEAESEFTGTLLGKIHMRDNIVDIAQQLDMEYDREDHVYVLKQSPTVLLQFLNPYKTLEEDPENYLTGIGIYDASLFH